MSAQEVLSRLVAQGLTPDQISEKLEGRVSSRTIYRWIKGEFNPQNQSDLAALRALLPA